MSKVKCFEKIAEPISLGLLAALGGAASAGAAGSSLTHRYGGKALAAAKAALAETKHRGGGILDAFRGHTSSRMAEAAQQALSAQRKKHLGIGLAGASGLAGLTYLKGRNDGMKKHAGVLDIFKKKSFTDKAKDAISGKYKAIEKYLKALPDDTKKHLLKKVKIKKGHLYAAGAGVATGAAGAGYLAGRNK